MSQDNNAGKKQHFATLAVQAGQEFLPHPDWMPVESAPCVKRSTALLSALTVLIRPSSKKPCAPRRIMEEAEKLHCHSNHFELSARATKNRHSKPGRAGQPNFKKSDPSPQRCGTSACNSRFMLLCPK